MRTSFKNISNILHTNGRGNAVVKRVKNQLLEYIEV